MSELRRDPLSGRWFVLAAERANRPEALSLQPGTWGELAACPFCPGNEEQTVSELYRHSYPDGRWAVRVVPNKYAQMAIPSAISPSVTDAIGGNLGIHILSTGSADVVIESPDHDATFDTLSTEQAGRVIDAFKARYSALSATTGLAVAMVFRNYLAEAGASLRHPHSQILASTHLPGLLEAEVREFGAYKNEHGSCVVCAVAAAECDSTRAIDAEGGYLTLAPYASRAAFEILIIPGRHAPDFRVEDSTKLATVIQKAFRRVRLALGDIPCNFWIHCRPFISAEDFHWHIHLLPRLTVEGAWELGTGLAVNVVPPDEAALVLGPALYPKGASS